MQLEHFVGFDFKVTLSDGFLDQLAQGVFAGLEFKAIHHHQSVNVFRKTFIKCAIK